MAQFPNGHAAEREPMFPSKGFEPFNRFPALDTIVPIALGRFKRHQNDILSVLKCPFFEPLIDVRLDFGPGDLDRHASLSMFIISWNLSQILGSCYAKKCWPESRLDTNQRRTYTPHDAARLPHPAFLDFPELAEPRNGPENVFDCVEIYIAVA